MGRSTILDSTTTIMQLQFDLLINSYLDYQVGIAPGFLTPSQSSGLQQNIRQLQNEVSELQRVSVMRK